MAASAEPVGTRDGPGEIWLFPEDQSADPTRLSDACLPICGRWLKRLNVRDRIRFKNARRAHRSVRVVDTVGHCRWAEAVQTADVTPGTILRVRDGRKKKFEQVHVRIVQARVGGERLRADKGINLPETTLHLPALTEKDIRDLPFIVAHADIVGYSFVLNAADVGELEATLHAPLWRTPRYRPEDRNASSL